MPSTSLIVLSVSCIVVGTACILFPQALMRLSAVLNRPVASLDERLMLCRYLLGLVLFGLSYGLFRLALIVPIMKS